LTVTNPIRTLRPFLAAVVLVLLVGVTASCGIDEDKVAGGAEVDADGGTSTTTTGPNGPDISLPDIPPDVTEPDDTVAETTETTAPEDTTSSGETTPGGLSQDDLEQAFIDTGFTEDQAACMAIGVFSTIDGDAIDSLATGDEDQVDPEVFSKFQEIVQTCVQGG
jgi:hypothetical protein